MRWDMLEPRGAADSRAEDKQKVGTDFMFFEIVLGLETNATFCPPDFLSLLRLPLLWLGSKPIFGVLLM